MNNKKFTQLIWNFYHTNKRTFPWRETTDPYKIMVSEFMLQQTQTSRVLPKYNLFLETFPTVQELASSQLSEVLKLWSGLGYNRRAKYLHHAAITITNDYSSKFPNQKNELQKIPGIGEYTASAIVIFSYNKPLPLIETNIRRTYIHHFFQDQTDIPDSEIIPLIKQTIDEKNPREWYYALMDYGVFLKDQAPNPNRKSKHYTKQSKFEGSVRKVRGEIIRQLLITPQTIEQLSTILDTPLFEKAVEGLMKDQLVSIDKDMIKLK